MCSPSSKVELVRTSVYGRPIKTIRDTPYNKVSRIVNSIYLAGLLPIGLRPDKTAQSNRLAVHRRSEPASAPFRSPAFISAAPACFSSGVRSGCSLSGFARFGQPWRKCPASIPGVRCFQTAQTAQTAQTTEKADPPVQSKYPSRTNSSRMRTQSATGRRTPSMNLTGQPNALSSM